MFFHRLLVQALVQVGNFCGLTLLLSVAYHGKSCIVYARSEGSSPLKDIQAAVLRTCKCYLKREKFIDMIKDLDIGRVWMGPKSNHKGP